MRLLHNNENIKNEKLSDRDRLIELTLSKLNDSDNDLDNEIINLSATELSARISSRKYTSVRVLEAYVKSSIKSQVETNCLTEILFETSFEIAKDLDEYLSVHGNTKGPLHGVPISLKDMINFKNYDSTIGFLNWIGDKANDHSAIVKVLMDAGAVPFVKTNVPQTMLSFECSNPLFGCTTNPYNSSYTSGGSSGGEAALLATKGSALGLGTDIGGSLRIPTGYCGIYSIKPSSGRWPMQGMKSTIPGYEGIKATVGPMTRSVEDLELMSRTIFNSPILHDVSEAAIAPVPYRQITLPKKLRFGYYSDSNFVKSSPAVRRSVFETIDKLRAEGHECIDVGPVDSETATEIFVALSSSDGFETLFSPLGSDPREPALFLIGLGVALPQPIRSFASWFLDTFTSNKGFARILSQMRKKTVNEYWKWTSKRQAFAREFRKEYFQKYNLDGMIAPLQSLPNVPHGMTKYLNSIAAETITYNVVDSTVGIIPVTKVDKNLDALPPHYGSNKGCRAQILEDRMYSGSEPVYDATKMHGLPVSIQVITEKAYDDEFLIELMKVVDNAIKK